MKSAQGGEAIIRKLAGGGWKQVLLGDGCTFFAGCWCCCLVTQSCLTLCNCMECSPPGSSVHGISQARILEWIAISFSRGSDGQQEIAPSVGGLFRASQKARMQAASKPRGRLTMYGALCWAFPIHHLIQIDPFVSSRCREIGGCFWDSQLFYLFIF